MKSFKHILSLLCTLAVCAMSVQASKDVEKNTNFCYGTTPSDESIINKTQIKYVKNLDSKNQITSFYNVPSLMKLVKKNNLNAVKAFLNTPEGKEQVNEKRWISGKGGKYHPITIACKNKNYEMVKTLLENGAWVNVDDGSYHDETPLYNACCKNDVKIAVLLIQHGAKTEINWYGGKSGIAESNVGIACINKNLELLKVLVEDGKADVNALDQWGCPPIYYAWKSGDIEITKYLINKGAQPSTKDNISQRNIWKNANDKTILCLFEFFRKPKNYKNIEAEKWVHILSNSVPLKDSSEKQIVFMQRVILYAICENLKNGTFTNRLTFKKNPLRNEKNVKDHLLLIEIVEDMVNLLLGPAKDKNSLPKYDDKKKTLIEETCLVDPVLLILEYDHNMRNMSLKQYSDLLKNENYKSNNLKNFASAMAAKLLKITNENVAQEEIDKRDNKKFGKFGDIKISFNNNNKKKADAQSAQDPSNPSYESGASPLLSVEIFNPLNVEE